MSQDDSDSCGGMEIVEDEIIASPQTNNKNKNNTEDEDIIVDEEIITNKEGSGKVQRRRKSFRPNQFQVSCIVSNFLYGFACTSTSNVKSLDSYCLSYYNCFVFLLAMVVV